MVKKVEGEPYARVSVEEAAKMVEKGVGTVIDVRNRDEYEAGHVKGAMWLPVDEVIPRFEELPQNGDLLFICMVGARSGLAAEYAAAMGMDSSRLYNIEEGTPAWIEKGLPTSFGSED